MFRFGKLATRLVLPALLGLPLGCASEREPINRVQPHALEKSFFVGKDLSDASDNPQFYYRPTVVDVDFGAGQPGLFTASYAQTLARVNFEITEDLLVARLGYERVSNTGDKGVLPDNSGQIVAAFKIQSHFDIKKAYNPQTGEALNIVEENTVDRPWYQREFMRVDWSQNLVTSAYELDTLAALRMYADQAIQYEPATYSVADPRNPDAPVFDPETGYFDITNKVFAKPELVTTPYGTFPTCMFSADFFNGSGPIGNCNPVELKIRLSFRRVVDSDYEPVDWDGQRMSMFGVFTTGSLNPDRLGYDRDYGVVDSRWYRFASRHNLWSETHVHDASGGLKACSSDASCDTKRGEHCDTFKGACTLPYRERELRKVPYYYGPESDPTLFDATAEAAHDWDTALRHAVQTGRYAECVHEQGGVADPASAACANEYPTSLDAALAAVPPILVMCHNPVQSDDPEGCGEAGLKARVGDLRYHIANVIQAPQVPSPWGIMADAVDPTSGEVIAASVNIWNAVTDMAAQRTVDMMRWYAGELTTDDVVQGNYVKALNAVADPRSFDPSARGPSTLSETEVSSRIQSMDKSLFDPEAPRVTPPAGSAAALLDWADATTRSQYGDSVLGLGNAPIQSRLAAIKGTSVETSLVTAPYLSLVGLDADAPLDGATLDGASPLRGGFWQNRSALERQRQLLLARAGSCVLNAAEPWGVIQLAQTMLKKFPIAGNPAEVDAATMNSRNQKWKDYIRKRLNRGVIAHEMGHSMGLRHVFTSSFDAINFRPQYWQLRTRDKQETGYCATPTADGSSCIGPRWNDPVTNAEREGMLTTWQQTSVMDYPGDITQDMLDIGPYDRAAIRFLYTDVADIWNDERATCQQRAGALNCSPDGGLLADQLDTFGGITGAWYGTNTAWDAAIHYSRLDQRLDLIRDCKPADTSPPADWNAEENGIYDPTIDGQIVNGTSCSGIPTDYVRYADLTAVPTRDGPTRKFDALGRVRRPYMFASDEYADIGNIAVYRHDNGADAYEIASYLINEYEDIHAFDNHRRGRTTFTLSGAFMRSFTRYHEKLKEMGKGYALLQEIFAGASALGAPDIAAIDGLSKAHALATSLTFDHFARMLTRPTSGDHFLARDPDPLGNKVLISTDQAVIANGSTNAPALTVSEGTQNPGASPFIGGRPLHNALDGSKGYYATRYDTWVGSYYEKTLAMDLLADSIDRFISQSRDDFSDGRYRNVSFATLYPEGVRRLVATALTQDSDLLGWRIAATGTRPRVQSGTRLPLSPLGFRVWWPEEGPRMCWPAPGQLGCGDVANGAVNPNAPATSLAIDPEVGFEVQKFITLFSLLYLPDSWKRDWVDLMRIYQIGSNANPQLGTAAVGFRDPVSGEVYVARSYGKESIEGRVVDRGVGARVLEWANLLAASAYQVESTAVTGEHTYVTYAAGDKCPPGIAQCVGQAVRVNAGAAAKLAGYKSVIEFSRSLTDALGFYGPNWRGIN
jgi:hypothetical protein